jgi:hypothetical protein
MTKWYRKEKNYTFEQIDGSNEKLALGQTKADLKVLGLTHFSWKYVQSETLDELRANRAILIGLLRVGDRHYINDHWRALEKEVVYYYIKSYANLGLTSSQRGESYHPVVREITSGQLSFEDSGKALSKKILSICKDLDTHEHSSQRGYKRLTQLHGDAFSYLRCTIANFSLKKIEAEWEQMKIELREQKGI